MGSFDERKVVMDITSKEDSMSTALERIITGMIICGGAAGIVGGTLFILQFITTIPLFPQGFYGISTTLVAISCGFIGGFVATRWYPRISLREMVIASFVIPFIIIEFGEKIYQIHGAYDWYITTIAATWISAYVGFFTESFRKAVP